MASTLCRDITSTQMAAAERTSLYSHTVSVISISSPLTALHSVVFEVILRHLVGGMDGEDNVLREA